MRIVMICLAAALLLALAALLAAFKIAFYSRPRPLDPYRVPSGKQFQAVKGRMLELVGAIDALPFEPVSIVSHDGLRLSGRYYHLRDGAPLQINFHGYRGSALQDFCGGMTIARAAGRNVLLIDERAQGESEGRVISFGVNERRDCLQWAEYAVSRFGAETKIILSGVSMGAATVLMASELPLPANVKCIIADCPYSSPEAIIRQVCGEIGLFGRLMYPFTRLSAILLGGFRLSASTAVSAVRRAKVPILLIHGEADHYVPCSMSAEIAAACASPVRRETFPGAGHVLSFLCDGERYARITEEFLASCGL